VAGASRSGVRRASIGGVLGILQSFFRQTLPGSTIFRPSPQYIFADVGLSGEECVKNGKKGSSAYIVETHASMFVVHALKPELQTFRPVMHRSTIYAEEPKKSFFTPKLMPIRFAKYS
jgi:hypothetical protein